MSYTENDMKLFAAGHLAGMKDVLEIVWEMDGQASLLWRSEVVNAIEAMIAKEEGK
jgi:hypothetical protein